jgi:thiamine biosynthesis lipoprotein
VSRVPDLVRTVETMGTVVSLRVRPGPADPEAVFGALARARSVLQRADAVFSTWKPHSPMSRLRQGHITLDQAPPEVADVLDLCRHAKDLTGGWFDPWAAPGGLDPTGLVKGWAARAALECLAEAGVGAAIVNAGGDAATLGGRAPSRPWRLGIQDPFDPAGLIAVVEPGDGWGRAALATSGTYERGEHIWNPFSRTLSTEVVSASVSGPDLALADALATALVAGGRAAMDYVAGLDGYEALLVHRHGQLTVTPGFPAERLVSPRCRSNTSCATASPA